MTTFTGLAIDPPTTPPVTTPPATTPAVTQATATPGTGVEQVGDKITLTLGFNEAVTVAGKPTLTLNDEIYQMKGFSRDRVRVLVGLDAGRVDLKRKGVKRADKDFAVVWARDYGKGRVLYNGLGHSREVWDRPEIRRMWLESVQWSMGLVPGDVTPRPAPSAGGITRGGE